MRYFIYSISILFISVQATTLRSNPWRHLKMQTSSSSSSSNNAGYTTVMIIPTGVGASIGGYAGDALPSARLMAAVTDTLIVHPNIMNGAMMYWQGLAGAGRGHGLQYVEGYALDEFAAGRINLAPFKKKGHRIGLLLDKSIEKDLRVRHLHVANAARATLGIDVAACVVTSAPVGVSVRMSESGASWGSLGPEGENTLIAAAEELVRQGCTAIAVVCRFPEDDEAARQGLDTASLFKAYQQGKGVDAIAGAEALISHVITKALMIPCAHAPAFDTWDIDDEVNPKSCAEELGYTFLPCVLAYLHRSPSLISASNTFTETRGNMLISAADVDSCVVPVNALGGPALLALSANGALIVAVEENETSMKATAESLELGAGDSNDYRVVRARSYAEAAGIIAAHREGILLNSITSYVAPISVLEL